MFPFGLLLRCVMQPLLEYLDAPAAAAWTGELGLHHRAWCAEADGALHGGSEILHTNTWYQHLQSLAREFLQVDVPLDSLQRVFSQIVPDRLNATKSNALLLLCSDRTRSLVGPAQATQVLRKILAHITDLPLTLFTELEMTRKVGQDLVEWTLCVRMTKTRTWSRP